MDNREDHAPAQGGSEGYTINEFLALIEPEYRAYKNTMCQCIAGLTGHAAQLAAQGQEEQLPQLRRLCVEMAQFWVLTEDDTVSGIEKMTKRYTDAFDHAVSQAKADGYAPALTTSEREAILEGLELYAKEMRCSDSDLEDWAVECDDLAKMLEGQWQAAPNQGVTMGGMT